MSSQPHASRQCVRAKLTGGVGNWLYIAAEAALLARVRNESLSLPRVLHEAFIMPLDIQRNHASCRSFGQMRGVSRDADMRKRVEAATGMPFAHARARTFRQLFGRPKGASHDVVAIHLRTVSDTRCKTHTNIRLCEGACVRQKSLQCLISTLVNLDTTSRSVVVMSDSLKLSVQVVQLMRAAGIADVYDESWILNASNHSGHSMQSAKVGISLWTLFARSPVRFATSGSTFSKSALLSFPSKHSYLIDMRCEKARASDGALFTCKEARLKDLV